MLDRSIQNSKVHSLYRLSNENEENLSVLCCNYNNVFDVRIPH